MSHADHVGTGQGIPGDGLHERPGQPESRPDQSAERDPGDAEFVDDQVVGTGSGAEGAPDLGGEDARLAEGGGGGHDGEEEGEQDQGDENGPTVDEERQPGTGTQDDGSAARPAPTGPQSRD